MYSSSIIKRIALYIHNKYKLLKLTKVIVVIFKVKYIRFIDIVFVV